MRYIRAYLAVVLWMTVIYAVSTDVGSSRNTARFIGPILRWFKPDVSQETIKAVQTVVRKTAHVVVYAVLALLTWRAQRVLSGRWKEWNEMEFWAIIAFCLFYAISDEAHQSFVSSRQGSPFDVMIDTAGAVAALLLVRWWVKKQGARMAVAR